MPLPDMQFTNEKQPPYLKNWRFKIVNNDELPARIFR
jgi:hypothetical protein